MRYVKVPEEGAHLTLHDTISPSTFKQLGAGAQAMETPYGTAMMCAERLFRVVYNRRRVLWIPDAADELKSGCWLVPM